MIIAECCTNWTDLDMARVMIKSAKENGATRAKFQLFDAEDDKGKPHYEWVKAHELNFEQAKMLFDYGAEVGIEIFFSVFGVKYVDWCERIGVKRYKLAYGFRDPQVLHLLRYKPLIVSVNNYGDIPVGASPLYCVPDYPTLLNNLHMPIFGGESAYEGYSDHTIGLDAAKIALARGASIIEKHFILDRENSLSPEKDWSMNPEELRELKRWEAVCQKVLN